MSLEIKIRPAQNTKSDLAAAQSLLEETLDYHAQVAGDEPSLHFRPAAQSAYLQDCLWLVRRVANGGSPQELALLAFLSENERGFLKSPDKPVGFLMARIQHDLYYSTELYGYIEQLIVTTSARNLGVGSRLLEVTCDWLRSQQVHTATLKVYGPNLDALRFYQREGFHPLRHELVKHF